MDFEELAIVDNLQHHPAHVIGRISVVGNDRVEHRGRPVDRVVARNNRRRFAVRQRQIGHQRAGAHQHLDIILERAMGDTRCAAVHLRPAQLFGSEVLVGHRLHHIRPGDEHVARPLDHEDEIGDGGRIDGAAGARAHDQRDLRHHARCQHVALEHLGIAAKRGDAFLDARAARIIQPDQGDAGLDRLVHDLADFCRMRFRQ